MKHHGSKHGIERLVSVYVDAFQIPENLEHYAPEDFEKAQRRYVRFCLQHGPGDRKGGLDQ
jgi:hypothetical protein